jgi:hypothetical protein
MENTRLAVRLLGEVAAARAAITLSYMRLWRREDTALDSNRRDPTPKPEPDPPLGAAEPVV